MKIAPTSAPGESSRDRRAETIRNDIAARLRPVCRSMSDEEFFALIEQMTQVQLRGEHGHH